MKKILFSDLDGTLLKGIYVKNRDRISIKKTMADDFLFIIATGRNFKSFKKFVYFQKVRYNFAILGNGSQIINSKNEIIHEETFEVDDLLKVLHFIVETVGSYVKFNISITLGYKTKLFKNYKIINDSNILHDFPKKISSCCISIKKKKIQSDFFESIKTNLYFTLSITLYVCI